jgi:heat shock protein HtpX
MPGFDLRIDLPRAHLSRLEKRSLAAGVLLITVAVAAVFPSHQLGGPVRATALVGLAGLAICSVSRGIRLYRAGVTASLPTSVGRVPIRTRPSRAGGAITVILALVLPLGACVGVLALVSWSWIVIAGVLLLGGGAMSIAWVAKTSGERAYAGSSQAASVLLERLCMRADMRVPELVVEGDVVASSWTARGRIHVTSGLLKLLDDAELEAVLAHELAHIAHRDAAVMEICSAPSRMLLTFAGFVTPRLVRWMRAILRKRETFSLALLILAVLGLPPAFVMGWISRLSVLGMSRAREFSADAAAVALTGGPSALASALLKLQRQREWTPRADLRQVEAFAVLCIVGTARHRLGRLFATHPPIAARVKRLEGTEIRLQAGSWAAV